MCPALAICGPAPQRTRERRRIHFPPSACSSKIEQQAGIKIVILVAQVESIPDEVRPGLSKTIQEAVIPACERIVQVLERERTVA